MLAEKIHGTAGSGSRERYFYYDGGALERVRTYRGGSGLSDPVDKLYTYYADTGELHSVSYSDTET